MFPNSPFPEPSFPDACSQALVYNLIITIDVLKTGCYDKDWLLRKEHSLGIISKFRSNSLSDWLVLATERFLLATRNTPQLFPGLNSNSREVILDKPISTFYEILSTNH